MFTYQQRQRYDCHFILPEIGEEGQQKIGRGRALVVGTGGLGSPIAYYLVAAGIGTIGLVDFDAVDLSNLQRQILHTTPDVGRPKVVSAYEKLHALNPDVNIIIIETRLTAENADEILAPYDLIIDATDSFDVKYLINDTCLRLGKPFIIGGIQWFVGMMMTHTPGTATYRDIFGDQPREGETTPKSRLGVFGAVAGMLGTIIAAEALKYFTGVGTLMTNTLLSFDAKTFTFSKVKMR